MAKWLSRKKSISNTLQKKSRTPDSIRKGSQPLSSERPSPNAPSWFSNPGKSSSLAQKAKKMPNWLLKNWQRTFKKPWIQNANCPNSESPTLLPTRILDISLTSTGWRTKDWLSKTIHFPVWFTAIWRIWNQLWFFTQEKSFLPVQVSEFQSSKHTMS